MKYDVWVTYEYKTDSCGCCTIQEPCEIISSSVDVQEALEHAHHFSIREDVASTSIVPAGSTEFTDKFYQGRTDILACFENGELDSFF